MRSEVINAFHTVDEDITTPEVKAALVVIREELRRMESHIAHTPTCFQCPDCGAEVDARTAEAI